jgi:hypothetical protein
MDPKTQPKHRGLGDIDSVLPRLVGLLDALSDSLGSALDDALVSEPTYELPQRIYRVLELISDAAAAVSIAEEPDRSVVLHKVQQLMNEIASLAEYLSSVLRVAGEKMGAEKYIKATSQKLGQLINVQFKVPLNKIKHEGFFLGWLTITHDGQAPLHGFAVNGLIERRTIGPASFRYPNAVAEGYSFAFFLRRATVSLYELCDLVDAAIRHLYSKELGQKSTQPARPGSLAHAEAVVRELSYMPFQGFPNEHMNKVPELGIVGNEIVLLRTRLLRFPDSPHTVSTNIVARKGYTFRLPYWCR